MIRKWIYLVLAVVLAYFMGQFVWTHSSYLIRHLDRFSGLGVGIGLFICMWALRNRLVFIQNWLSYFSTRVHESAHEKMAFLSGRRLFGYNINENGSGHIVYECKGSPSPLITLAPYFFSYISLILLAMRWMVVNQWLNYYDSLMGFLLAFHIYVFLTQTREILPLNWTATKICNLVVNYEKRTQKIQCELQS